MEKLERQHGVDSVAFEMLGPPRLSKLLYEAHLLKLGFATFDGVIKTDAKTISAGLEHLIRTNSQLRSQIKCPNHQGNQTSCCNCLEKNRVWRSLKGWNTD